MEIVLNAAQPRLKWTLGRAFDNSMCWLRKIISLVKEKWLLHRLQAYPIAYECFYDYVRWVFDNIPSDHQLEFDLIRVLSQGLEDRLIRTEALLVQAIDVLDMTTAQFSRTFGFKDDLLAADTEKIFDILAEPAVSVYLDAHGFNKILKILKPIKINYKQTPTADFTALRDTHKYAIEVKTVRMEKGIEPGKPMGNAQIPNWWGKMLFNNAVTKIEDKNLTVVDQLNNTAQHLSCDRKMLVLHTRRLGPSTLLDEREVTNELETLTKMYTEIDCFCVMLYFGDVYFYPKLDNHADSEASQ